MIMYNFQYFLEGRFEIKQNGRLQSKWFTESINSWWNFFLPGCRIKKSQNAFHKPWTFNL